MKELIQQKLAVHEWPLTKPGDKKFFGYVVAIGVFPHDWVDDDGLTPYVDFAYNDKYTRYRLPHDESLRKQLLDVLRDNLDCEDEFGDIYGKVWIKLSEHGYSVDLP